MSTAALANLTAFCVTSDLAINPLSVPNTYHVHSSVAFLYLFKMILFLSLSPENSDLYLPYFADLICCEDFDSNSFCFVLKMYFSLLQLFVWFDMLSVTVFVIRDRFVKKLTCA